MRWFKNRRKRKNSFRNPKIYTTTQIEKEQKNYSKTIWFIVFVLILVIFFWWIFYSKTFEIKNIIINGEINDDIKNEINNFYGQNIIKFTIGKKDDELANKQSSIEKIEIIKGIPDTLKVEITTREPKIRWKTKDKIYYVDEKGYVFELNDNIEEYDKLLLIEDSQNLNLNVGGKLVTEDFVNFITDLDERISSDINKEISKVYIEETTLFVVVELKDSYKIYFDTTTNINKQIYILKSTIEKHDNDIKDYIDLRIPSKAYYK